MKPLQLSRLQSDCDALLESQQTLLLATRSSDGEADISYAPFLHQQGQFYIFISELARHTQNLLAHPRVSLMIIQPEAEASNPFARQRLTLRCSVDVIARDHEDFAPKLTQLTEKFGETIHLLASLPDFHLMALTPLDGLFVAGFGKAMVVDASGRLLQPAGQ